MGNQDPDVNEFDELVVVRLLLHDGHFFDQNGRREYGEKLLAQWDKGLLCQQAQTIRDLVNGDKRKLLLIVLLILNSSMITQHASSCDEANDQIRVDEALVETRRVYDKSRLSSYGPSLNFDRVA